MSGTAAFRLVLLQRVRGVRPGVLAVAAAAPAVLLLAHLLPANGLGLAVRLATAAVCLLVLPGALLIRAVAWPAVPAFALAASIAVSLGLLFVAFAATFAVGGTLNLTLGIVAAAALAALVPAAWANVPEHERSEGLALLAALIAGIAFAGLVWWTAHSLGTGDVLFHLGRARKLAEADTLSSVNVVNEFRDGGLHPGYAFPLWHGVLALVARLAGVDVSLVVLHFASALTPLAFAVVYAAGRAVFGTWAGGIATLAAQVGWVGLSSGVGSFELLALPATSTRLLLVPTLLALLFAYLREPSRWLLLPIAAAALTVAVAHPSYLVLIVIPLSGFAVLALAVGPGRRPLAVRLAWASGAVAVPVGLFFLWLWPTIADFASYRTVEEERARALAHYGAQLQAVGDGLRAAPDTITRGGPVIVAALLLLPLAALGVRRWWAAFAVGGMLLTLFVLLVPAVFTPFVDAISVSQGRRLAQFLPVPFVIAAAAVVAGRFRIVAAAVALAAGTVLELAYEAEKTHIVESPGPIWPFWVAAVGAPIGVALAVWLGPRLDSLLVQSRWTAIVACAFVAPIAVGGLADLDRTDEPDPYALSPALVRTLDGLDHDSVVFAPVATAYRVTASAPVYVAATLPFHVADTGASRPYRRQGDTIRFFKPKRLTDAERSEMLARYGADWLLVDKTKPYPREFVATLEPVYEDRRYILLRVPEPSSG
jgi:hypothetical protein